MDGLGHFHTAPTLAREANVVVGENQRLDNHVLHNVARLVLVSAPVQAVARVEEVVNATDLLVSRADLWHA